MWRTTLRGLLAHRSRLARTALAIALGVAFVAGTFVLTDTINEAFTKAMRANTSNWDVAVRARTTFTGSNPYANEREQVPESLLKPVQAVKGVARAEGGVEGYAQVVDKQGKAVQPMGPPTLGVSWSATDKVVAGHPPRDTNEVVLDQATADKAGYKIGDRVRILSQGPARDFLLVGLRSSKNMLGATLAGFEIWTAQAVLDKQGKFDTIAATAEAGVSADVLRNRIAAVLPDTAEALTNKVVQDEAAKAWTAALSYLNTALLVFAAIALLVGGFIILNTFSILVAQRTRELGLLRAIGASREQVLGSVLGEAGAVGLIGSGLGLALGFALALGLLGLMRGPMGIDMPATTPVFAVRTAVVAIASGMVLTAVAAAIPARAAGRVPPVTALSGAAVEQAERSHKRVLVGAAATLAGAAALSTGLFTDVLPRLGTVGAGAVLLFVGIASVTPVFAVPFARLVGAPLTRLRGEPGRLARQNAMRNPRRTALTASALMVGLGLVGVVTVLAASLKASSYKQINDSMRADFVLSPKGMAGFGSFSPDVARKLAQDPNIGPVLELRIGQWGLNGKEQTVVGLDPKTAPLFFKLNASTTNGMAALQPGTVVVRDTIARRYGWHVGDRVPMEFGRTGLVSMPIAGIINVENINVDYAVDLSTYDANYGQRLDNAVYVLRAPGQSAADTKSAIDRVLQEFPNIDALDQAAMKKRAAQQVNQMLAMVSSLLAFSVLIAVLGIANTLSLSILERRREIGLLRAVGMSRRQIRSMIRWEAVITALLGAVLGTGVAVLFGWALTRALSGMGVSIVVFPIARLAAYVVVAAVTGVIAAMGPARRAAKLDVLSAVASE